MEEAESRDEIDELLDRYEELRAGSEPSPPPSVPGEEVINGSWRGYDGRFTIGDRPPLPTDGLRQLTPDRMILCAQRIPMMLRPVLRAEAHNALRAIKRVRSVTDELEYEAVAYVRSLGWPWRDIADALGVSTPTAHRRHARSTAANRHRRPMPKRMDDGCRRRWKAV